MIAGRLEVFGWFGAAASTHWLATQSAMGVLERGGNAFDGAVVAGFVMQVAQPHLNGPAGEVAILMSQVDEGRVTSICGQGPAPAAADPARIRELGLDMVPGTGLLSAVVPGAFDAWMHVLARYGTIEVSEALALAIEYADKGVPVHGRLHDTIAAAAPMFTRYWTDSASMYLTNGGMAPAIGSRVANPVLAAVWRRVIDEANATGKTREGRIEAARAVWSDGFIAQEIDRFCRETQVMDVSGRINGALLRGSDLAGWRAAEEPVVTTRFAGYDVHKCGQWTQGPSLLQALNILDVDACARLDPNGSDFVHLMTEALKLALSDRDAHYGMSASGASIDRLLTAEYAQTRRMLIADKASFAFRPGGDPAWRPDYTEAIKRQRSEGLLAAYGGGEPTIIYTGSEPPPSAQERAAYLRRAVGDTSYLSVADKAGNVVSATPSGGWLQSSPVIPGLGFALGTRAQMMWLDEQAPSALRPSTRPRSTLAPTLAISDAGDVLALGTPGGDQQDQWQFTFLARHLVHGLSLQEALDAPGFHTNHVINSFYPRGAQPASLVMEDRFDPKVIDALAERGHKVTVVGPWVEGRLCAVRAQADGSRHAAVSARGGQSLASAR